ncbi:protein ImuA [Inhella inkyongensis]|uniref:Protein ImuA n=1 Tax=Inhella inkyongensis TaxID=392593 RepID=A0A840S200_9BURK|nr:translesion DNA synthesis-associated protein ImuA [Inhella inkyongensis]MBB5203773.1 protein ImuA [Inhella inkyongensis]
MSLAPPLLDLFGEPLRLPTRRERQRVAMRTLERASRPVLRPGGPPLAVEGALPLPPQARPRPDAAAPVISIPALVPTEPPSSAAVAALLQRHPSLWRGQALGLTAARCWPSGHALLDAELPGGGWPTRALTELLLAPQAGHVEWRLLAPVLKRLVQGGRRLLLIQPPYEPHPQGLAAWGLAVGDCLWVQAPDPLQRQWALEQALRADADELGAVLAWLQAPRAAALRRLQTLAAGCRAPVFVCHASANAASHSAAPLRLQVRPGPHWTQLQVELLKRRGPPLDTPLWLHAPPPTLRAVMPIPQAVRPVLRPAHALQA